MKNVLLFGLGGAAVIICALYFIFRNPREPEIGSPGGLKNRYYVNPAGQKFEFSGDGVVTATSSLGKSLSGTYTRDGDVVRMTFENEGKTTTMEFIETVHGMAGMAGRQVGAFYGTNNPEKVVRSLQDTIENRGRVTKMEMNVATLTSFIQIYATKNNGQPPSAAAGLRALVTKRILTDEGLLTDPWGTAVEYRVPAQRSKDKFDIFSAGVNGISGDEDDIGNWTGGNTEEQTSPEYEAYKAFGNEVKALGDRLKNTKGGVLDP